VVDDVLARERESFLSSGTAPARVRALVSSSWQRCSSWAVAVDGLAPRSVGLAKHHRGQLSAPARAVRDAIIELVEDADQPGLHPALSSSG